MQDLNEETVEDLEELLQKALQEIESIALLVANGQKDTYEGFMESEKYKDEVIRIGHLLKEKGIDISQSS
jgi:Txe/YoeB family toxin of Txe-Axe toxin-antitoxin module